MTTTLQHALAGRVPDDRIVAFGPGLEGYLQDQTRIDGEPPCCILKPRTTQEVAALLAACNEIGQKIVVQGGRTGLSGGARPRRGEAVLSLERMTALSPPDLLSASVVAEAGVPLQVVQEAAQREGLFFGVDIGARGTATIGGNIATNAGGIRVLRYGMFRRQVLGLEAVLADGTVLSSLNGLVKDNSGYDLKQLFIGSEGTLGVVTRARLALHPAPRDVQLVFCACPSLTAALELMVGLRRSLGVRLSAFEAIWGPLYDGMTAMFGISPLAAGSAIYLIIEAQDVGGEDSALEQAMLGAHEDGLVGEVVVATSLGQIAELWLIRDNCSEFVYALPNAVGHDISVEASHMVAFFAQAQEAVKAVDPRAEIHPFGHLGDGNIHYIVNTTEPARVSRAVFGAVAACGGSISAEHGIGLDKKPYLSLVRSPGQIEAMRRLKSALDPRNILNPGRIFDLASIE